MVEEDGAERAAVELHAVALSKRFGARLLFRRLTFHLKGGQSIAISGANGSGKSTLLRILAGVMTPTAGRVDLRIDGQILTAERHPLMTGLVAPYLNVYDGFTPRENLLFIARARRLHNADDRVASILETTSLSDRADDPVGTFSSGMKQRIKYAAALLANPPLLLLDEPRVNLDAAGLEMVNRLTERQRNCGGLLVVATNDEREALRYDDVIRIEEFR